jgi:hypothetical protein
MRDRNRKGSTSFRTWAVIAVAFILAIVALSWESTTHIDTNPGPSGTPGSTAQEETPPPAASPSQNALR